MIGLNRPSFGALRSGLLRSGGTAQAKAARTSRRCTPKRRDNSRIDTSGSRSRVLRIFSYNLTFDSLGIHPKVRPANTSQVDPLEPGPGGAKSDEHYRPRWSQIR